MRTLNWQGWGSINAMRNVLDEIPTHFGPRLTDVHIWHAHYATQLLTYNHPDTFAYLDPPYLGRRSKSTQYMKEMQTAESHIPLLKLAREFKGKLMISGYDHDVYEEMLVDSAKRGRKTWHKRAIQHGTTMSQRHTASDRTEIIWQNY
jgi:DNA adenine methylase